jgi:diguanylate cyclase (GGDEF)-like protein
MESRRHPRSRRSPAPERSCAPSNWLPALQAALDARPGARAALLFVDVAGMRTVNESFGFRLGDLLLDEVRALAGDVAGAHGIVGPGLAGDQFTVLVFARHDPLPAARGIARRIAERLDQPVLTKGHPHRLGAAIGIAVTGPALDGAEALVRSAECAMHLAKDHGGRRVRVFDERLRRTLERQHVLLRELGDALAGGELCLHYQPIVDARDGRVLEAEALLRWEHRAFGMLTAGSFIDVAERAGLILPIGRWVFAEASRQAAAWAARWPGAAPRVTVNVSARQLAEAAFVEEVAGAIREAGADPGQLVVELTEHALIEGGALETVRRLSELGLAVFIDDFGTGFSSFDYLKRLPAAGLKVDRTLLDGATEHERDAAILEGVVGLAGLLGLRVIVEGVETARQIALLRRIGCDALQGFGLHRPAPAAAVEALVEPGTGVPLERPGTCRAA